MPTVYVIGGPNGAGKTTLAETLLPHYLKVSEYVNADRIAGGLSAFNPGAVAIEAGRLMVKRMHDLAAAGADFACETTLSSLFLAGFLKDLKGNGYSVTLIYVWLKTPALAMKRVRLRAEMGGHDIPREVVARRYERGLENLRALYLPEADSWYIYDNSGPKPALVSELHPGGELTVHDVETHRTIVVGE
jgi:predicted ABC-type ATPase